MSRLEVEGEDIPYMPGEMLAAGENHPTVTKALALKRLCWSGAIAFSRRGKSYLLWVGRGVRVGMAVASIDGGELARGRRVVEGSGRGGGMGSRSIWTENAWMVDGELDGDSSSGSDGEGVGGG